MSKGEFLGIGAIVLVVATLVTVLVIIPTIGLFVPWNLVTYSEGDRTGILNKISYKGLICKRYLGYILVGNGQNVQPEEFDFTVKDEAVANQLKNLGGKIVTLNYNQYFFHSLCWGANSYEVTSVQETK